MGIALLVVLIVIALAAHRIATALTRIDAHNRRFTPEAVPGSIVAEGSLLLVRSAVGETLVAVVGFGESDTGVPTLVVEPA